MIVRKALIIDSPWIEKILTGEKTWEMRSTRATHRGPFALIQKGSGQVKGIAHLDSVSGPYSNAEIGQFFHKHHVGPSIYEQADYKWRYAWELSQANKLKQPVDYRHKNGAVTWVDLDDDDATHAIAIQLGAEIKNAPVDIPPSTSLAKKHFSSNHSTMVPVAKDGSFFSPTCNRSGTFTVGEKGNEVRFNSFSEALKYLQKMPTAKWRRPNSNGNWGIVSAREWQTMDEIEAIKQ
ncbi:Uncharacterised protein [Zhongshania aliphaticivorans]|uniref:Uncharacterized protein n=1 Tax=Zhongshania aliphaticivorans TaxID=1470434 RepID=A0A5S9N7G9_9GAMM|nr:ASCH domain-containing protein [Zhongshania aliphaticivorans]CAA0081077.1 Uncharacterised protein [Zhongshania aliphaticivorans]CAA0085284.1 Uncharacterised protein [Zhongshania aliphaticivorans]